MWQLSRRLQKEQDGKARNTNDPEVIAERRQQELRIKGTPKQSQRTDDTNPRNESRQDCDGNRQSTRGEHAGLLLPTCRGTSQTEGQRKQQRNEQRHSHAEQF